MSKLLFRIGGLGIPDDLRLQYALERAERGEDADTHITFTDAGAFFGIMTAARMRLMQYIHDRRTVPSIRALAEGLERSYANMHHDVQALLDAGLLEQRGTTLMVSWDGEDDPSQEECGAPDPHADTVVNQV
ncbi:HVO_A0114 family putative DNA-binding protein [Rhodopila globiformis]|uniref:HTH marR-type domain-containing protein n=1 Tax=Rhodopila globiformis TaxID=1071 RepID=A0A2S6N098_RHOGL|nr:hypothetical protein [Rhodopila globiformis]PPQ28032.1 hypothetical protein CCS01_25535 [Rhodopila globiformis]